VNRQEITAGVKHQDYAGTVIQNPYHKVAVVLLKGFFDLGSRVLGVDIRGDGCEQV
jgi:hypothetical protein